MQPKVVLVDENDKTVGLLEVDKAHLGEGKRHRAFVTLLFDGKGRVLLQKRKHRLFDGLWDFTAISHPLRINGKSETYQEASDRALKKEMGIGHVEVEKVGGFNYIAREGKYSENEYCAVLKGEFAGKFKPNDREVYEAKWVKFSDFMTEVSNNAKKYTKWAKLASKFLKKTHL